MDDHPSCRNRVRPTGNCSSRTLCRGQPQGANDHLLPPFIRSFSLGDALMSTTARLDDLKRDLARLERKRTGSPRQGRTAEGGRGREAEHPGQIPSRGWMDVLWRAWGEVGEANLFLIAGGVTTRSSSRCFPDLPRWSGCMDWCSTPPRSRRRSALYPAFCPPRHRNC